MKRSLEIAMVNRFDVGNQMVCFDWHTNAKDI